MLLAASASVCFNLLASVHFDLRCASGSMAISTPAWVVCKKYCNFSFCIWLFRQKVIHIPKLGRGRVLHNSA